MDIVITIMNILGIRDICNHIIALEDVTRRIITFMFNSVRSIGDFLIYGFLLSVKTTSNAVHSAVATIEAISQEISFLTFELTDKVIYTVHAITAPFVHIYKTSIFCYQSVCNLSINTALLVSSWCVVTAQFISSWSIYIINFFLRLTTFISSIPEFSKQCLITLGNTIWLWASMIPLSIVYVTSMSIYLVGRCCEEISSIFWELLELTAALVNRAILFWADMPLESMLGLIIGTTSVIFVVKYGWACVKRVITFVEGAWNTVFYAFLDEKESVTEETVAPKIEEILCVICQDRARRVVSFPCRHLCTCRECSDELTARGEPCPMCRQHVSRTLTVFT